MKKSKNNCISVLVVVAVLVLIVLGFLGYIPLFKPRDLGVTYTEADRASARAKSQIEYEALPADTPDSQSLVRTGSRAVSASFTSAEITALMNDRPYKYWPFKDVQMKFNADGSAEVSGRLIKDRIPGYAAAIGVDSNVASKVIKYLPPNPVFYVKGKAALSNNQVSLLDPSKVEIGRASIPLSWILAYRTDGTAFASDLSGAQTELAKYTGKKQAIVNYINQHLASLTGFFAKKADFSDNALNFDGNLNEKELTVR